MKTDHTTQRSVMKKLALSLFLTVFVALTSGVHSQVAHAGRYELIKKSAPGETYRYSDTRGVCDAYEKNLNRFVEEPYGMACGRKLDPSLGFSRPTWEKLDILEHADLVRDIYHVLRWDIETKPDPRPWSERLKAAIEWGAVLEVARVDINEDGKPENLVRYGKKRSCDPREVMADLSEWGRHLFIGDSALAKIRRNLLPSEDVILYRGNVYTDMYGTSPEVNPPKPKGPNAVLFFFGIDDYGAGVMCKLHYYEIPRSHAVPKGGIKP